MAKKATKRAAPVKPERTASRLAPVPEQRQFQIEKLGRVYTWNVPENTYKGDDNLRTAFIGGFRARAEHVNQDTLDVGVPIRFAEGSKEQQAFEDGYHAAANQDGLHLKPAALTGSTSKLAPARPVKRR